MRQATNSEDDIGEKRHDVYMSFTSGATFGMVVAVLVLLMKSV
ncbi:MAG: hypothetical protein AB1584_02220 [Pseudomonadota bacterium]